MKPIMYIYNNHDVELVKRINILYNKDEGKFIDVLTQLAIRDRQEIRDTLGIDVDINKDFVKVFAYDILMHICDNQDLEYICNQLEEKVKPLKVFTATPQNAYSGGCVIFSAYDIVDAKKLLKEIEDDLNNYYWRINLSDVKELQGVSHIGKRGLIDTHIYME